MQWVRFVGLTGARGFCVLVLRVPVFWLPSFLSVSPGPGLLVCSFCGLYSQGAKLVSRWGLGSVGTGIVLLVFSEKAPTG